MKLFIVLLGAIAFAAPILPQAPSASGTLRGVVVREGTSEPLRDVQVKAGSANALTDGTGRFTIQNLPPGSYAITAQREGYFGVSPYLPPPNLTRATATVTSERTTEVTLTLVPGATVSGRVFDPSGGPFVPAMIEVLRVAYENGNRVLQLVQRKEADDRGEYRLFQLPPDDYYIAASTARSAASPTGIASGGNGPVRELRVRTFYPSEFDAINAVPVKVRSGDDFRGMDIRMRTAAGSRVSGRIISQLPAPGVIPKSLETFFALRSNNSLLTIIPRERALVDPRSSATPAISMNAPTNGSFTLVNVPPGSYDLFANLPDLAGWGSVGEPGQVPQPIAWGRASIDVRGRDLDGVNIVIHSGVDVKGRVFVDGRPTNPNVAIALQPIDSALYSAIGRFSPEITADGSFTIPVVPEGRYRFQPTVLGTGELPANAYVADVLQGGTSIFDDGIRIGTVAVDPVAIQIATNGGVVRGTVVGADRQPAPAGITVALIPPAQRRQNPARYRIASTDSRGAFAMEGVAPDSYKAFAWENVPAGAYLNADFLKTYEERGTTINVTGGTTLSQAINLIPFAPTGR